MTKGLKKVSRFKPKRFERKFQDNHNNMNLDSPTSSTTTTTSSATTDSNSLESLHYVEEANISLNSFQDISYESAGEEARENLIMVKSLAEDMNYFKHFSDLPDINSLTESISITPSIATLREVIAVDSKQCDKGHFVDPLTGLEFKNHDASSTSLIKSDIECEEEESAKESPSAKLSDLLISMDTLTEGPHKTLKQLEEEQTRDLIDNFFQSSPANIDETANEFYFEALRKEQELKQIQQQILKFIYELIGQVVDHSKLYDSELMLKQKLDKRKLLIEMFHAYTKYQQEGHVSQFLNKKMVEFYKRRKLYQHIQQKDAKALPQEREKYMRALQYLDESLAKKRNLEESFSNTSTRLHSELSVLQHQAKNEVMIFTDMVKKTLHREESPKLKTQIENSLKKMARYRKDISDVRYELMAKQHSRELLLQQHAQLDNLDSGLSLKDYDLVHNTNQNLSKKIEELDIDLKKLYERLHKNLHIPAHIKESRTAAKEFIASQTFLYEELLSERVSLRKYVYALNLKRNKIQLEIDELNMQAGLLNKPLLLYDYDQTEVNLQEQRIIVGNLRDNLQRIQQKINKLETRLTIKQNLL